MKDEFTYGRSLALKKVAKRSLHSQELEKFLLEHQISSEVIQKILQDFIQLGFLDDPYWLASFIRVQTAKGYGPIKILQKLKAKGIEVPEIPYEKEQQSEILTLLERKYPRKNLSDPQERNKIIRSLMRRGFSLNEILSSLKQKE